MRNSLTPTGPHTYPLTVRDVGGARRLCLEAPHGPQWTSGMTADVAAAIAHLRDGDEITCVCSPGNIREAIVERVLGPATLLAPVVLALPAAWTEGNPELALAQANAWLDRDDARARAAIEPLTQALDGNAPEADAAFARLSAEDRDELLDAYALWRRGRAPSWRVLQHLPIERWRDAEIDLAVRERATFAEGDPRLPEVALIAERVRRGQARKATRARRDAALRDVWAAPDDDDTRVVVGDVLLEQGDLLGEFIHLSFQLASGRATRAARRRYELLEFEHGVDFAGALGDVVSDAGIEFDRGFPTALVADRQGLRAAAWREAAEAPNWSTVRVVTIHPRFTPAGWIAAVARNPWTGRLRTIRGDGLEITRAAADVPWRVHLTRRTEKVLSIVKAFRSAVPNTTIDR